MTRQAPASIAARDTDGKRSDLVRQEHEVRVPANRYEEAQGKRFGIDTQLLMEPGRYKISVALLDPLTRQDSYRTVSRSGRLRSTHLRASSTRQRPLPGRLSLSCAISRPVMSKTFNCTFAAEGSTKFSVVVGLNGLGNGLPNTKSFGCSV